MTEVPKYALLCWADAGTFYVQLPGPEGPVTLPFPIAKGGLAQALPLLQRHFKETPRPITIPTEAHNPIKDRVQAILKKQGLVPV